MTFPVDGAWQRQSVSIGGSAPFETQRVYWLQAGPEYADLRVPFHPAADARCFAGRSGWASDGFRWAHRLDLEAAKPEDVGELTLEGGRLVERGWFGDLWYEEVWVRIDDGAGPWLAAEAPGACLARVGAHAITVVDGRPAGGAFAACYRVLNAQGWQVEAAIGAAASLPSPDDVPPAWLPVAAAQ